MSDSDSDGVALPRFPRATIEQSLKDAAAEIFEKDQDNLTLKRVRATAESKLGLVEGWFKAHLEWNPRSKEIVTSYAEELQKEPDEAVKNAKVESAPAKKVNEEKSAPKPDKKSGPPKRGVKRASPEVAPTPRKKKKIAEPEPEEKSDAALSEPEESAGDDAPAKAKAKAKPKPKRKGKEKSSKAPAKKSKAKVVSELEEDLDLKEEVPKPSIATKADTGAENGNVPKATEEPPKEPAKLTADDSSSELSSVIDDLPPPKKSRQKKSVSPKPTKASKSKPKKSEPAEPNDPNAEEIKRLQGWLVKCGIRKVWGKELAPFPSPREKIAHLRQMLKEAGMDGRYSVEKARQIKEQRELAADLEAVKDFEERWGKKEEQETRKRGAQRLLVDFSDDEDSD